MDCFLQPESSQPVMTSIPEGVVNLGCFMSYILITLFRPQGSKHKRLGWRYPALPGVNMPLTHPTPNGTFRRFRRPYIKC